MNRRSFMRGLTTASIAVAVPMSVASEFKHKELLAPLTKLGVKHSHAYYDELLAMTLNEYARSGYVVFSGSGRYA